MAPNIIGGLVGGDVDRMRDVYMTSEQREAYERLRRDAERYRWLRVRWGNLEEIYEGGTDQMLDIRGAEPGEGWRTDPATLDAAIDAAMNGANTGINATANAVRVE